MKIQLNYDQSSGQLTDNTGMFIATYIGIDVEANQDGKANVETLVKLKNAGFSADEIIELSRKELV